MNEKNNIKTIDMTNDNRKDGTSRHTFYDNQEYNWVMASSRRRQKLCSVLFALLAVLAAVIIAFCVWLYFFDR
jgi:hypothetical protein